MRWLCCAVLAACGGGDDEPTDVSCRPQLVFLARDGGMYDHGPHDDATANRSVILDGPRALAPWPRSDWTDLVACITAALAPFPRLVVTDVDPGLTPHVELVFTTSYWAGAGTTMIAPSSCRPGHQLLLVFGDAVPTTARACHVALQGFAQMTALLSLNDNCRDFVNNHMDCAPERAFLDQTASCVDAANQPAPCRCGGGATENTYQSLAATFPPCP